MALAETMANAALTAMRDPRRAICSLLTSQDGEFSIGKDTGKHNATAGAHVTNCCVESNFGCMDILMRMFRHSTVENMAGPYYTLYPVTLYLSVQIYSLILSRPIPPGIAQQMRNQDFERPANVDHGRGRKRKQQPQPHRGGFFYTGLTPELQQSLVEYTRGARTDAQAEGREALRAQEEERLQKREERVQKLLTAAIDRHAEAKELYKDWMAQRAHLNGGTLDKGGIARALNDAQGKPLYLRRSSCSTCGGRSRCVCWAAAGRSTRRAGRPIRTSASAQ